MGAVVHCDIIPEYGTALGSKGCAIAEFESVTEAQKAIRTLQDTKIRGRPIFIREDREDTSMFSSLAERRPNKRARSRNRSRSRSSDREFRSGHGKRSRGECGRSVYVGNLPYSATWQDLKDFMRAAGNVVHCDI